MGADILILAGSCSEKVRDNYKLDTSPIYFWFRIASVFNLDWFPGGVKVWQEKARKSRF